jgi:hypothetical protein
MPDELSYPADAMKQANAVSRELARDLMSATRVIAILVQRLGGMVEITTEEFIRSDLRLLREEDIMSDLVRIAVEEIDDAGEAVREAQRGDSSSPESASGEVSADSRTQPTDPTVADGSS